MPGRDVASPLVSVLLPVYNAEDYLERCIDSVLSQTYPRVEVVAVDDGSRDGSGAILDRYAAERPGSLVVEHRENGGVAAARNRAIELARGDYLMFLDNDDYLDPDCVGTFVEAALRTGAQVVCGGFRRPNDEGRVVAEAVPVPGTEWAPFVVEAAWAKIYDARFVREAALSFLPTNIGEDLYFTLPAVTLAKRVETIDYCGYNWFYNASSVSSTSHRSSGGLQFEESLDAMLALVRDRGIVESDLLRHYFVKHVTWFLLYTCRGDSAERSRSCLRHYVSWLDRAFPGWRRRSLSSPLRPMGETFRNRAVVWLFAAHPRLFALALSLYRRLGAR